MVNPSVDLVILRHGEAEPYVGSDAQRALTQRGRDETKAQMTQLANQGFTPDVIIHSPYVRTTQTATICQDVFATAVMSSHSGLMHSAEPEMVPFLWGEAKHVLLVSHMPLVARLVNYLCPGSDIYGFSVSGYIRLTVMRDSLDSDITFDASRGFHGAV